MKQKNKYKFQAVFLDRDGTINYDSGYTHKFSNFKFRPKVIEGLKFLTSKKFLIFIVTNQAGVAKGKFKLSDLKKLHIKLKKFLRNKDIIVNEIQYCPYHPKGVIKKYRKVTNLRKPGNLMIKKILRNWNIDLKKSFMIGDKNSDKIAAKKSNVKFYWNSKNFHSQVKKIINNY